MSQIVTEIRREFDRYRTLAEKAIAQVADADLSRAPRGGGNSIATIVWHLAGNLRSRFTDFRTADGEKSWRRRDGEFVERPVGRDELFSKWRSGWEVLFTALDALTDADLDATVVIRAEPMPIGVALQRSVTHAAYHCGQIVYRAKELSGDGWRSLSIPVGESDAVNRRMGYDVVADRITIEMIPAGSPEAQALIAELDAELAGRYPAMEPHGLRDEDLANPLTVFAVGRLNGTAVACGATRPVNPEVAEVKRMYVKPAARGRGFSRQILQALEDAARASGVSRLVLETGDKQPEAIALYMSAGYAPIPRYGEHLANAWSRCFEKRLAAAPV